MLKHTPLWGNSLVRRADEPFFTHSLLTSIINTLEDIWNYDTNRLCTYQELLDKHGPVIDFMLYASITAAIPRLWKYKMDSIEAETTLESKVESQAKHPSASRNFYWKHIQRNFIINDVCALLWSKDLNIDQEDTQEKWTDLQCAIRQMTGASKLRLLQYKILNRCLTTNLPFKMGQETISPLHIL